MVIYDKKHETIGVSTMSEATVFAQGSANNEDSCASVADTKTDSDFSGLAHDYLDRLRETVAEYKRLAAD